MKLGILITLTSCRKNSHVRFFLLSTCVPSISFLRIRRSCLTFTLFSLPSSIQFDISNSATS